MTLRQMEAELVQLRARNADLEATLKARESESRTEASAPKQSAETTSADKSELRGVDRMAAAFNKQLKVQEPSSTELTGKARAAAAVAKKFPQLA